MFNLKCIAEKDLTHTNYLFYMSHLSHSYSYLFLFVISDVKSSFNMKTLFWKFQSLHPAVAFKTCLTWRNIPDRMTKMSCYRCKYDDQQIAWVRSGGGSQTPRISDLVTDGLRRSERPEMRDGIPGNMGRERESRSSDEESWESAETLLGINTRPEITQRGKNADHENRPHI